LSFNIVFNERSILPICPSLKKCDKITKKDKFAILSILHMRALEELMCKELQKYIFGISEHDFIYSPLYAIISNYSHMK
jgi:hypothetical protein